MTNIADRYTRLCRAYVQLADRFQKLDVEYMTLKGKLLPLLKGISTTKEAIATLKQEKANLESELKSVMAKYEALSHLEVLLKAEAQAELVEAEEQLSLVEQTIQEMESESDPDLDDYDKGLLNDFLNDLGAFSFDWNGASMPFSNQPMSASDQRSVTI
jgi:chromosome segregation ATPase